MDSQQIGALIRRLRLERGMTQKQLADALFVTPKTVSKWECGVSQT
ncbi:MAG: helix-turn-helix transcriptional regulator [Ruminococcus sp.]|nr:helix-turn-helix transcriptional regulator [Ruminococcus sp.]